MYDFTSLKNRRLAQEEKYSSSNETTPEALENSYTDVWGGLEKVILIDLNRIVAYTDGDTGQPFKINPKKVEQIAESAKDIGILTPVRLRPKGDNYEVVSGHHRVEAARAIGLLKIPSIIKSYTDEEVFKVLSESNIQREKILPSEYAKIFARYMEARKELDMTSDEIANKFGVSKKVVYRHINVLKLNKSLQDMIDNEKIAFNAIDYIMDFSESEQLILENVINQTDKKLNNVMAKKLKQLSVAGMFADENVRSVISPDVEKPQFKNPIYNSLSAKYELNMTEKELDELVTRLLEKHFG